MEKKAPGTYWFLQARAKHFDRSLLHAVEEGVEQVVILGAGYDTRAYRFREALAEVAIFEVDVASTQAQKKRHLNQLFGAVPNHVCFVEIDFNTQSIPEVLEAAGFERGKPTFFLWEGVIYYLPEESVRSVLGAIRELGGPGSMLVIDYILQAALEGDPTLYGAAEAMRIWNDLGEPGLFGWEDAAAAAEFLAGQGFEVTADLSSTEMAEVYEIPGRIIECMRLLDCRFAKLPGV